MSMAVESIPGYHLKTTLGAGGMATVYLAVQNSLERQVAIKVLAAELIDDPVIHSQFAQESKLIASLSHPNIIQVIDRGYTAKGHPYFVMPYVKSIPLSAALKRNDISSLRKIDIVLQICKALAYAHRNGVVHRDIKPANILVDYEGHVRLVDFGIAGYFAGDKKEANISDDLVMGTDAYMAPEQHDFAGNATPQSDIYSLGVVMHQLFLGVLPYESNVAVASQDEFTVPLRKLINACLHAMPAQRPESATALYQQLLSIAQGKHLKVHQWSKEATDIPANFQLMDVLKENPYGATYLVKDPKQNRFLVVKKQRLDQLGQAEETNKKLSRIQHPHLVRVYGTGKNQRVFISVSEYSTGGSLQERLTQSLTLGQWILIAQQMCSALACAHEQQLVHGNLRPSNILFAENNFIKLGDFGFPPHTYAETDNWYSLEQEGASVSADIYAAGAILFQLLSGRLPKKSLFNWKNYWALRHIPAKLREVILKMTRTDPGKRFANAKDAMKALQQYYDQQNTRMAEKVFIKLH